MFTNTFTPHVGGVARSVSGLAQGLRQRGHGVLIVAPTFPGSPDHEEGVIRIPAMQRFAGSDFSVPLPVSLALSDDIEAFRPDIVHSHHPFLLGDTALRVAAAREIPVVFTHHTRYELYDHYVAQDSDVLKRLVLNLSLGYCDLCDYVVAPSESIAKILSDHGVATPVTVIPSGVDPSRFTHGDGGRARRSLGIPKDAFVVGHVGRLAPEKNLTYLAGALATFLEIQPEAHLIVTGDGPMHSPMNETFRGRGVGNRIHFTGTVTGDDLADVYEAMDVFAFSSLSETQGLVLAEAMTAGTPVVALDAPGAREVVRDGINGRLLSADAPADVFAEALNEIAQSDTDSIEAMEQAALETAEAFSAENCLERTITLYRSLYQNHEVGAGPDDGRWQAAKRSIAKQMEIIGNVARSVSDAVLIAEPRSKPSHTTRRRSAP